MELTTEPYIYSPSIDEKGNYIDKIPAFHIIKKGLIYPCASRKDKFYESYSSFSSHIKTKNHQKWLTNINLNRMNYYIENIKLQDVIENQKIIIAKMDKDLNNKLLTIDYLTQQLNKNYNPNNITVNDLLNFD